MNKMTVVKRIRNLVKKLDFLVYDVEDCEKLQNDVHIQLNDTAIGLDDLASRIEQGDYDV